MDEEMSYANRPIGYDGTRVFFYLDRENSLRDDGETRYLWSIPKVGLSGHIIAGPGRSLDFNEMANRIESENEEALTRGN